MSSPPVAAPPAQPTGPPPLGNVNESVALTLLADMLRTKKITDKESEEHKQNYVVMHERVVETRAKEETLAKLVRFASCSFQTSNRLCNLQSITCFHRFSIQLTYIYQPH
jgi:hypothetical protein